MNKQGQHLEKTNFYLRINNATHKFVDDDQKQKYIAQRRGPSAVGDPVHTTRR